MCPAFWAKTSMRMIQTLRNFTGRSLGLGIGLTAFIVALDAMGMLAWLEGGLYDSRAQYFQHFTPPPSDRLVHLDIDDAALETIGRWPWPRTTLADIVDEVRLAGADVLALDIIFPDPQPVEVVRVDGKDVTVDHDANLAAAFERFGRVLVPVSFNELGQRSDKVRVYAAALEILRSSLELDHAAVSARLTSANFGPITEDFFISARREALSQRIRKELERARTPADELR